jgi:hypothetical protein
MSYRNVPVREVARPALAFYMARLGFVPSIVVRDFELPEEVVFELAPMSKGDVAIQVAV